MNRFKRVAWLLALTMILSSFSCVMAEESADITVTNNAVSSEITSAWGGSLLIAADAKRDVNAEVSVKVTAADGTEIANVPVSAAVGTDNYAAMKLLVHKNSGKFELYSEGKLVSGGAITGGADKTAAKLTVVSKGGTVYLKNVSVSDYMDTADKTEVLFESDFSAMPNNTNVASGTPDGFYCDDWYASDRTKNSGSDYYCDIQGSTSDLFMRYIDTIGGQSVRHMIKDGGTSESFEISTQLLFPHWNNRYDGGFRMFLVDENGNTIDLIKAGTKTDSSVERGNIPIYDGNGEKLFDVRGQTWTVFTIKVDLNAQMYTVAYKESAGSATSNPISLPNMKAVSPYALTLASAVGIAKDVASTGSVSFKFFKVMAEKDPSFKELIYAEDFNNGIGDWQFSRSGSQNSGNSLVNGSVEKYKGHTALLIERKDAKFISASTDKTDGKTHYGTLNEDGTLAPDPEAVIDGSSSSWATNSATWYVRLPKAITVSEDVCVEYDVHLGGKAWKYNANGDYYSPRDLVYASLGSYSSNTSIGVTAGTEYMSLQYSEGAIFNEITREDALTKKIMPSSGYYTWTENGPAAEWVSTNVENNGGTSITITTDSKAKGVDSTNYSVTATDATVDTLAFTIGRNNGGACYIDNIKIYTKDSAAVKEFNAGTTNGFTVAFAQPTEEFAIHGAETVSAGAAVSNVIIGNYSGNLSQSAFVAAVLYEKVGDELVLSDCKVNSVTLSDIENNVTLNGQLAIPRDFSADKYSLKIFLFDGAGTLKPLSAAKIY